MNSWELNDKEDKSSLIIGFEKIRNGESASQDDMLLTGLDEVMTFENKTICLIGRYPFWSAFWQFLSNLHIFSGSSSDQTCL
jgi:polyferredoxin